MHARIASSFISPDQAVQNLKELGNDDFDTLVQKGKDSWNNVLGKIEVEGGNLDQYRHSIRASIALFFFQQILRTGYKRKSCSLQPIQRTSASRIHVHRHRFLGHLPLPVSFSQLNVSVGEPRDAGRSHQYLQGKRILPRMGKPRTQRLHDW